MVEEQAAEWDYQLKVQAQRVQTSSSKPLPK